jgi:hypothetical protein
MPCGTAGSMGFASLYPSHDYYYDYCDYYDYYYDRYDCWAVQFSIASPLAAL